jgi:non-heme chloroperoxidase
MKNYAKIVLALVLSMSYLPMAFAGKSIQVSPDLEIYYEEAGTGRPLIFITGWTGTGEFFMPYQLSYFSQKYHTIAYDPRG